MTQRLLCELIAIPSVNPAFLPEEPARTGEQAAADFLANFAAAAGLEVEYQKVLPRRPNVLARLTPAGKVRQRVILAPHLDTIGRPGEWKDLFNPVRKSGRIYGRGACDTKGCIAAMMAALHRMAHSGFRPAQTEIVFAGLIDEENAQAGSRALAGSGLKAELAIVGEPTRLLVVTAHKGDVWLRLETAGKAAHGARPELGRNAVHEMAKIVDLLESEYASQLRKRRHPVLGSPTVNVGSIGGGTQPNIVPASCFITVDRRTIPGETESGVRLEIKDLLSERSLRARMTSTREAPCLPLDTDVTLPLVREFMRMAGQEERFGVDYFCDAAVLAQAGIPSVVFGPGDIAQAHTVGEWISVRSLEAASGMLERFLRSLP
jgi:acetylornithine deacetylase/succinyl-diaminopimelate desuccinylase-like protein